MRLAVAILAALLAVPAHAGGLPPLIGGGYVPLDCAATVSPRRPGATAAGDYVVRCQRDDMR
jgi:hypothetical protein